MNELYANGGVIYKNPSQFGGTWAFRVLADGMVICEKSGVITPEQAGLPSITNNLTEMIAVIEGFRVMPSYWVGRVFSDSQVTLGRVFMGWKWNNIPLWLHHLYQAERKRLMNWDDIKYTLLDGHPTQVQLEAGKGKRGGPVSIHNVWCEKVCGQEARRFVETRTLDPHPVMV